MAFSKAPRFSAKEKFAQHAADFLLSSVFSLFKRSCSDKTNSACKLLVVKKPFKKAYLLRETLHQNGDQQVEQHIVAERHQYDEVQRGPMKMEGENGELENSKRMTT